MKEDTFPTKRTGTGSDQIVRLQTWFAWIALTEAAPRAAIQVVQEEYGFRYGVRVVCYWLAWAPDDPAWNWVYNVVWADVHQEPEPLIELLTLGAERPPKRAVPFVNDFLRRRLCKEKGPKDPYWNCGFLEGYARAVAEYMEEQGITLSDAVGQLLRAGMESDPEFLTHWFGESDRNARNELYEYCNSKTGNAWRKKRQREKLKNPPRFKFANDINSITSVGGPIT